jgi:hypothetical protein
MPNWLFILLVLVLALVAVAAWMWLPRTVFWIVLVIVLLALCGISTGFGLTVGDHKAAVKVGPGARASGHVTTTRTTHTTKSTSASTTPVPTSTTSTTTTSTSTTGTTASPPPASPGNPWPDQGAVATSPPTSGQTYPIDGQVHIFVDLNDVVHDGVQAHFSYNVINGTNREIQFSRAAVAMLLDGSNPKWAPIYDLKGLDYQTAFWWVRTGMIPSGHNVVFEGWVPIPNRAAVNHDVAVACLQGDLQITYPSKPNASIQSDVKSPLSCSEYSAG